MKLVALHEGSQDSIIDYIEFLPHTAHQYLASLTFLPPKCFLFKKSITSATLHSFLLFVCLLLFLFFFHFIFSLYDEQSWRIRIDIRAKRAFSLSRLQLYVFGSLVCIISFTEQFHKNTSERGMYAVIYIP